MKSTKEAQTRLDFIFELIKQYLALNGSNTGNLNIQVFGGKPRNYIGQTVKGHIINALKKENLEHYAMIEFFVVDDKVREKNNEYYGKKLHERFFCADIYYFNFEDSSQNRTEENLKQTWRTETAPKQRDFIDSINETSPIFNLIDKFDSNQLKLGSF